MQSTVRKWLLAATLGTLTLSPMAFAQQPPDAGPPVVVKPRVRGTIVQVEGSTLTVKATNGTLLNVHLNNNAKVVAIVAASLTDIKPGSFVGTTAVPQPGGALRATEVHIFPEAMRGTGEGHRAWDLGPTSTMTNGTVALAVQKIEGHTLTIKYKDGEKTVLVPPEAPVVTFEPGERAMLQPGAHIIVSAAKQPDGSLTAAGVAVGKDGLVPPM